MGSRLLRYLRDGGGFGLVELLIAMVVLNVGVLAVAAALVSGSAAITRASRGTTASTLADAQLELYRALTYSAIALDPSSLPSSAPYTTDTAYDASQVTATCAGAVSDNPQCNASRTVAGPDHGSYRVDTYVVLVTPANGQPLKQVTVVVRNASNLTGLALARRSSWFDVATGT